MFATRVELFPSSRVLYGLNLCAGSDRQLPTDEISWWGNLPVHTRIPIISTRSGREGGLQSHICPTTSAPIPLPAPHQPHLPSPLQARSPTCSNHHLVPMTFDLSSFLKWWGERKAAAIHTAPGLPHIQWPLIRHNLSPKKAKLCPHTLHSHPGRSMAGKGAGRGEGRGQGGVACPCPPSPLCMYSLICE